MKRAQATLEYILLISFSAAAIIAMLVYMSRGFQGSIRGSAEQIGSGQYAPGNTSIANIETKYEKSVIVSTSDSTTTYGSEDGLIPGHTDTASVNKEESTVMITRDTDERLGAFHNDTWR
ncbi:MAG: hypothetical protein WC355_02015 [Candidatus Omnitrophota bacterium]|jgi:hypothetical protein